MTISVPNRKVTGDQKTLWAAPVAVLPDIADDQLGHVDRVRDDLEARFASRLHPDASLSRTLVSFQANKGRQCYRWYKFKEGFSVELVHALLERYAPGAQALLDPFAGSGTALFASSERGIAAEGIELLPIGQQIIEARLALDRQLTRNDYGRLAEWRLQKPWSNSSRRSAFCELPITQGAYPRATHEAIEHFLGAAESEPPRVRQVLRFALLCILESVSYTRKDGQYLRWDHRSGRTAGTKPFDKGTIARFDAAICAKLDEILHDMGHTQSLVPVRARAVLKGPILLHNGSCLDVLPTMPADGFDTLVTSPPYCNRYDYTRTYALELALLGVDQSEISRLRQQMLSCTVENRPKDLLAVNPAWQSAVHACDEQEHLQSVLDYLAKQRELGKLNNNGVPRMVRGYFYELACVIQECARVLKPHGTMLVVNDNVRYAGATIAVDLVLSDIAEHLGFTTEAILVLPTAKGNSSQQMGAHGRDPLRKCVYVWRKGA